MIIDWMMYDTLYMKIPKKKNIFCNNL